MAISIEAPARSDGASTSLDANLNRIMVSLITLLGAALRFWRLGDLGLSYDEAATALMARATPTEIIVFHWTAGFEHPPFWQLLVHGWSQIAGQNEFALRTLAALAGILVIPLVWQLTRHLYPASSQLWHSSALLTAMAPILIYYSQEARMYAIVLVLAVAAMIASTRLVRRPTWAGVVLLALFNVTMTGFHYYAALLFAAQGIYFLIAAMTEPAFRRQWPKWLTAMALSALPLTLWMVFSPGFQMTLGSVLSTTETGGTPLSTFVDELWRDLTVAAIRWQPDWAWIGYLWLPLLGVGLLDVLWLRRSPNWSRLSGWYLLLLSVVPVLFSALAFGQLSTRYVLYVSPALFILMALGIMRLWNWMRVLGLAGMLTFIGVCLLP
jgi:mannosyltransferase